MSTAMPGDVILTRNDYVIVNNFIPGWYSHIGMVNISGSKKTIIDAVDPLVREIPLLEFLKSHCYARLCRDTKLPALERQKIADAARKYVGTPYDYGFEDNSKELYCIELVGVSYKDVVGYLPFQRRVVWGVETSYPEDVLSSPHFSSLYKSFNAK